MENFSLPSRERSRLKLDHSIEGSPKIQAKGNPEWRLLDEEEKRKSEEVKVKSMSSSVPFFAFLALPNDEAKTREPSL